MRSVVAERGQVELRRHQVDVGGNKTKDPSGLSNKFISNSFVKMPFRKRGKKPMAQMPGSVAFWPL